MRHAWLSGLMKRLGLGIHEVGLRVGVHVLPVHHYSPVPDIRQLRKTRPLWTTKSDLPGLAVDLDAQAAALRAICLPYQPEYAGNPTFREATARGMGPGFGYIEAQALHAVIRHYRPARIVEVGSGVSTYCMWHALARNRDDAGTSGTLRSIDPSPCNPVLALPGVEVVRGPVQAVPVETFGALRENDLLFVDSTHTVKPGGDVNYLILEVLPRLRAGVIVQFHDIFWPYDYQRDACHTFFHWSESSLLRAFLAFNSHARILFCLSHLHYDRPDVLRAVFPEYTPQAAVDGLVPGVNQMLRPDSTHFPSSTYIVIQ